MTITLRLRTKLSDEQRHFLLESLGANKIAMIYDDVVYYVVSSEVDTSTKLMGALDHLKVEYDIVNSEDIVRTFRGRVNADFKLAGNLDLFPLNFSQDI